MMSATPEAMFQQSSTIHDTEIAEGVRPRQVKNMLHTWYMLWTDPERYFTNPTLLPGSSGSPIEQQSAEATPKVVFLVIPRAYACSDPGNIFLATPREGDSW